MLVAWGEPGRAYGRGMRRATVPAALLLLSLTACQSGEGGVDPLDVLRGDSGSLAEALGSVRGINSAEVGTLLFMDAEAVARDWDLDRTTTTRPYEGEGRDWVLQTGSFANPPVPDPPVLVTDLDFDWSVQATAAGVRSFTIVGGAGGSLLESSRQRLDEAGYAREGDRYVAPASGSPLGPPDVAIVDDTILSVDHERGAPLLSDEAPVSEHPAISALMPCLAGAEYASLSFQGIGIGASVDDGEGRGWACLVKEGATQADADAVQPNAEGVEITGRSVEDGVIRLELDLTDVDAGLPAPLKLVLGLPEQTYPGF